MYISRSFTFPVFVFQLLDSAKIYLVVSLAAEFFVAEAVGGRQDPNLKKSIDTKGPALTNNKTVCSVFWALTAPVDRPTQLFYISISICCEYTNRRSTAGQSARGQPMSRLGVLPPSSTRRQGCINCAILPSRMGARGVSSEHVENMEMVSCSPT